MRTPEQCAIFIIERYKSCSIALEYACEYKINAEVEHRPQAQAYWEAVIEELKKEPL